MRSEPSATADGTGRSFFAAWLSIWVLVCAGITSAEVIAVLHHRQGPTLGVAVLTVLPAENS